MAPGSFFARLRDPKRASRLLLGLGALGYLLRVVLWAISDGSNDIRTWYFFALTIERFGLAEVHVLQPLYNHPPLMGLMSVAALDFSRATGVAFPLVFKAPSLLAELLTGLLLLRIYRDRGSALLGAGAFAAYGLSLSCIVISGYHGNTDAIYFYFAFLAAHCLERKAPFWAGVALGAAVNVKLIPILLGLPLASRCANARDFWRYVLGASIGAIPFAWEFLTFDDTARMAFVRNLFMYRSNLEFWGVESFVRWTTIWTHYWAPSIADAARAFGNWYSIAGGKLLLVGSAAIAGTNLLMSRKLGPGRRLFDAYELATLGFAMFLLLGSGFGLQYVGCIVAPLIACGILRGVLVGTTSGLFITIVYVTYVVFWWPIFSDHQPIPASYSIWSNLAWFSMAYAVYLLVRDARRRAAAVHEASGIGEAEPTSVAASAAALGKSGLPSGPASVPAISGKAK